MEQDVQINPNRDVDAAFGKENVQQENGKKPRNRSRAKKNAAAKLPNIPEMLANLEPEEQPVLSNSVMGGDKRPQDSLIRKKKQDKEDGKYAAMERKGKNPSGPNPPLPPDPPSSSTSLSEPPPPPPPPPPPSSVFSSQGNATEEGAKARGEKEKKAKEATSKPPSSSSQRTSGRIPKIKDREFPSHNKQWTSNKNGQEKNNEEQQNNRSDGNKNNTNNTDHGANNSNSDSSNFNSGKAYNSKAKEVKTAICYDVSSHRFIPEDDKRIGIMLRKMIGDEIPGENEKSADATMTIHSLPFVRSSDVTGVPLDQAPGALQLYETDESKFVTIADFATAERPDATVYHTIARRENITFIMVHRKESARGKRSWEIPPITACQDFINDLLSKLYSDATQIGTAMAYARSGKWGLVQTLVLHSKDMDVLADFRCQVTLWNYRGYNFDLFPRDVVVAKADISILLRGSMKTFQTELIPKVLFTRNADVIAGSLRVLSTKFFTAEEFSHKGESKEYWRSIELKGNEQFLRCLSFIPESRPFLLGYDSVQIRGGLRPQESLPPAAGF